MSLFQSPIGNPSEYAKSEKISSFAPSKGLALREALGNKIIIQVAIELLLQSEGCSRAKMVGKIGQIELFI